jgi:hypothetical protein
MALDLTLRGRPIFLTGNKLNRNAYNNGDLLVSSMTDLRHRLFDMDPASYWISSGSNDTIDETITFGLWVPGTVLSQQIGYFAIMNHNLKAFDVEFSNDGGSTWTAGVYNFTLVASANTRQVVAAPFFADRCRITMHTTQTANQEKQVGDIIVADELFQSPVMLQQYKKKNTIVKAKTAVMHDNSIRRAYVYRSDASPWLYSAAMNFIGLTSTEVQDFKDLHKQEPFIVIPEPAEVEADIFQAGIEPGTFTENYITRSRSGGYAVGFDVREVGGA